MSNTVTIDPRHLKYDKEDVERILEEVENRSFFRDMSEDEYESLSKEEKMNGDLYLLHEPEE